MKSWMASFREKLYRPNVGAAGELSNLRIIKIGHPWIDRLSVSSSWVLIVFVWMVLLVHPDTANWNVLGIIVINLAYMAYVTALEILSRTLSRIYDLQVSRILRIGVNLALVTGLVIYSSGANSYFWYLYTLPLFQANLYFRRLGVLIILAVTIALFWAASWDFSSGLTITPRTLGDLLTHSVTLTLWTGMLYWLFSAARSNRKREAERIESLRATSMAIVAHLDQPTVLNTIIDRAIDIVNASGAGIYEYDSVKEELTVIADQGGDESIKGHKLKKGDGMAGRVVENGTSMIVDDYSTWPWRSPAVEPNLFHAVVEVPLTLPGQILGVLYATNRERGKTFAPIDAELLSVLAGHAAIAINNAKTFSESNRNLAQLKLLEQVSSSLTYAANLADNLATLLRAALRAIDVKDGSIMIFDPKSKTLEILVWIVDGKTLDCSNHKKLGLYEGIAGHVAATGDPINCRDTLTDDRFIHSETDRPLRSILSIPIIADEKLLCIINADSAEPDRFDDSHIQLLSVLGSHVATMIESLRLREMTLSFPTLPLDELHMKIVESAFTLFGGGAASLFVKMKDKHKRVVYPAEHADYQDPPRDTGLTAQVFRTGEPEKIDDAQNDPKVKPEVKARGVASQIAVPLIDSRVGPNGVTKETIGVLWVSTYTKRQLGDNDTQLLKSLASHAASAIVQAGLHEDVARERDFQKSLMANSFDAVIAVNAKGRVIEFNPSAEKLLGYTRSEALGKDVGDLYCTREQAKRVRRLLMDPDNKGRVINHFSCALAKDGTEIPIRLAASLLENDGSVGFFRDETALEDMRQKVQDLPELDDVKSRVEASAGGALYLLEADVVWIFYYDHEKERVQVPPAIFPADYKNAPGEEVVPLITSLFTNSSDLFVEDLAIDDVAYAAFSRVSGITSVVASPLKGKDKTLGVMVCGYATPQSFDNDRKFLIRKYISDSAINAVEASHLPALLDGFYKMSLESTTADISLRSRLETVLDFAVKATGAQSGALGMLGANHTIKEFIHRGVNMDHFPDLQSPAGKGILRTLLAHDSRINEPDVTEHVNKYEGLDHPRIKSFLGTSILVHGKPVGNLYVGNRKFGKRFSQQDETFLSILANWASVVYKLTREREQANTQEAINITVVMLSQLGAAAAERGATWSTALRDLAARTPEDESKALQVIADNLHDLANPIHRMLEGLERGFSIVILDFTVRQVVAQKQKEHPDIKFNAETASACMIKGNDLLLSVAFNILIENAVRATRKANRTSQPITVSCNIIGELVFCNVRDFGSGIDEAVRPKMFHERFYHDGRSHENSFIVGLVLRWHDGEINVKHSDANGTDIEFSIPVANR